MTDVITIRPARPSDVKAIARIHVDGWRTAYAGFIPAGYLAQLNYEEDSASFRQWLFQSTLPPVCRVALDHEQIVGFAVAGPNGNEETRPYESEIYKLFVQPEFQGQGIGRRLIQSVSLGLLERGFHNVLLWAYSAGNSVDFYRRLGGEVIFQTRQKVGGQDLSVQVFAWSIADLLRRTAPVPF